MIRVGFTGTQKGLTAEQAVKVRELLAALNPTGGKLRHGDCIGSDADCHDIARALDYWICGHPPVETRKRAFKVCDEMWPVKPYLVRNRDIVDNSDRVIACPKLMGEELRSGTWATIRYTRGMGKLLYVVWPNGQITTTRTV